MGTNRTNVSLSEYVERRTGARLGQRGSLTLMLRRSLGAPTFDGFWRYWNPIWGYYLSRFIHAPLRRFLPAAPAVVFTFVVSGAIHDAAIYLVTGSPSTRFASWFAVLGLMVVATSRMRLRYEFRAWLMRATINIALIASAFWIAKLGEQLIDGW